MSQLTDGFLFYNELDMLRVRLVELYPVVDRFILVEADRTFRGNPKPYFYESNKAAFEPWADKIEHVKLEMPSLAGPWEREYWSREQIIANWNRQGILIFSDCDEIPRREIVPELDPNPVQAIETRNYSLFINASEGMGFAIKAIRAPALKLGSVRELRSTATDPLVRDGGWSFSSIGTPEFISQKLQSFSHSELDIPEFTDPAQIRRRMDNLTDLIDRAKLTPVSVDGSWPHEIVDNREYWRQYEYAETTGCNRPGPA